MPAGDEVPGTWGLHQTHRLAPGPVRPREGELIEKRLYGWLRRSLGGVTIRKDTRAETLNKKAMHAMERGKLDEAERLLLEAIGLEPDLGAAHHNLGALYAHKKRLPLALKHARHAARLDPHDVESRVAVAQIQQEMGKTDKALEEYGRIRDAFPDDWRSHVALGSALLRAERASEAVEPLRRAVQLAPKEETAHLMLATVYEITGSLEDAIRAYVMVKKTTRFGRNRAAADEKVKALQTQVEGSGKA